MREIHDFKKEYISKTGAKRKPMFLSDCNRFVFVECIYPSGKTINKWFWANHRLFN
jgi:hypothetical protein